MLASEHRICDWTKRVRTRSLLSCHRPLPCVLEFQGKFDECSSDLERVEELLKAEEQSEATEGSGMNKSKREEGSSYRKTVGGKRGWKDEDDNRARSAAVFAGHRREEVRREVSVG